ncbi:hypothetical protein BCR44DRAFT_28891 [Catenaria anguillulae PL171]|uniref:Secreted protein n=1 Tax=Catenaria anguillulae PL171 TaxID=765915 RepID=A0A1Y2H5F5_9FUNG|nr:hypothetical protein BCR44DRAFT_28891 [Catenaria anguillulae PL171]
MKLTSTIFAVAALAVAGSAQNAPTLSATGTAAARPTAAASPTPSAGFGNSTTGSSGPPAELMALLKCFETLGLSGEGSKCYPAFDKPDTLLSSDAKTAWSTKHCTPECVSSMSGLTADTLKAKCPGVALAPSFANMIAEGHKTICLQDQGNYCLLQVAQGMTAAGLKIQDSAVPLDKIPKDVLCSKCTTDLIAATDRIMEQIKAAGAGGAGSGFDEVPVKGLAFNATTKADREAICAGKAPAQAGGKTTGSGAAAGAVGTVLAAVVALAGSALAL